MKKLLKQWIKRAIIFNIFVKVNAKSNAIILNDTQI